MVLPWTPLPLCHIISLHFWCTADVFGQWFCLLPRQKELCLVLCLVYTADNSNNQVLVLLSSVCLVFLHYINGQFLQKLITFLCNYDYIYEVKFDKLPEESLISIKVGQSVRREWIIMLLLSELFPATISIFLISGSMSSSANAWLSWNLDYTFLLGCSLCQIWYFIIKLRV